MSIIDDYQNRIDSFLKKLLSNNNLDYININPKIIHDSVWGTNKFHSWEIALIDSPLLQRLRRIHQTGLAFLVYPTSTHTRFEHSLGVTILVEKLINHLNNNIGHNFIKENEKYNLRLSALLHDVGHSFLSHVSELVYDRMKIFQDLKNQINNDYKVNPKGHEIFSFLIVRSKVFQSYFKRLISKCKPSKDVKRYIESINWQNIAGYIIGYSENPSKKYLSDIINGPIDCDKLDYLARDAKFAGPVIVYDIDRFFYTINTIKVDKFRRLTVTLSGVNALEQIVISRMMLFSYIYHHHKVRCAEAMIKRFCFYLMNNNIHNKLNIFSIKLKHPVDFLKYTDEIILNSLIEYYGIPKNSKNMIQELLNRKLWVRAQMVSGFNIKEERKNIEFMQLERDLFDQNNVKRLKNFKKKIINEIKRINTKVHISDKDFWIDVPEAPPSDESKEFRVKLKHDIEKGIPLKEVFPLTQWVDAYMARKWRSHIFSKRRFQKIIYEASKKVIKEEFKNTIKNFTKYFCKIQE